VVYLDRAVLVQRGDFERILVHELFHFVWVRLSRQTRLDWEDVLSREFRSRAKGELGWSAEWRKEKLSPGDRTGRTPAWRRYVRESFCDSAARAYSGLTKHDEFTLSATWTRKRIAWMTNLATNGLQL
jgi:hypothetical protein